MNNEQPLESEIAEEIQAEASKYNITLFRNNSGAFKDSRGILVRYGLGNISKKFNSVIKSSDYIGFTEMTVTPDMVGSKVAIFTALEIKTLDWKYSGTEREVAQLKFIDLVNKKGGIASFVNSIESFKENVLTKLRVTFR